jgi:hopanoid biosynthesis associated protein HpnK
MKKLIVNADDFGLTERINQGIVEGHRSGIITSTTLMANGSAFDSALQQARENPQLGVGIHLNLTQGPPISAAAKISSLVDSEGNFCHTAFQLARRTWQCPHLLLEIETELRAQTEKVLSVRLQPSHLDGHKHFHAYPAIFNIIVLLARDYGIPAIRRVAERSAGFFHLIQRFPLSFHQILKQYLTGRALTLLSWNVKAKMNQAGLQCADQVMGITQTGFLDQPTLENLLCHLPSGCTELMCHAGYVDSALRSMPTRLLEQREVELRALTLPIIREQIIRMNIQLTNYRSLPEIP